jgi:hypothetical protein
MVSEVCVSLLYSPRWLFLYPGLCLLLVGLATATWLLPGPRRIGHSFLDIHTLLYAVVAILTGFQAVVFALFTNVFGITEGLLPEDPRLTRAFRTLTLERGSLLGTTLLLVGVGVCQLLRLRMEPLWLWTYEPICPRATSSCCSCINHSGLRGYFL